MRDSFYFALLVLSFVVFPLLLIAGIISLFLKAKTLFKEVVTSLVLALGIFDITATIFSVIDTIRQYNDGTYEAAMSIFFLVPMLAAEIVIVLLVLAFSEKEKRKPKIVFIIVGLLIMLILGIIFSMKISRQSANVPVINDNGCLSSLSKTDLSDGTVYYSSRDQGFSFSVPRSWSLTRDRYCPRGEYGQDLSVSYFKGEVDFYIFINDDGHGYENFSEIKGEKDITVGGFKAKEYFLHDPYDNLNGVTVDFQKPDNYAPALTDNYFFLFDYNDKSDYSSQIQAVLDSVKFGTAN